MKNTLSPRYEKSPYKALNVPFNKIFFNTINALGTMSSAGKKVLQILPDYLPHQNISQIIFCYKILKETDKKSMSITTFQKGIKDLISHDFIQRTVVTNVYWCNPNLLPIHTYEQ